MTQTAAAIAEANQRVADEMERFRAALPSLLIDEKFAGRWVVFKDNRVVNVFDDEADGYRWARTNLGKLSGFVLARVEPEPIHRLGGTSGFTIDDDEP
jgi:hypothetical protein